MEVGSLMFGKYDDKGKLIPSAMDLVRLAIPRRVYTQSHIDYVIALFDELIREKEKAKGYKILFETPLLRHFTCKLEPVA